jgi:hypothetical protein
MRYEEWTNLKTTPDSKNPFCAFFEYEDGSSFYIEPAFYTQLLGVKARLPKEYPSVIAEMEKIVRKNKKVIFTAEFESPLTRAEDYVLLEITDVMDRLHVYVQDKNRGSDYGD